jgi:hypothetical protein
MGVLTDIGIIKDGKLSDKTRNAIITDILLLLEKGNDGGRGISSFPLPLPPTDPTAPANIFWFAPQPLIFIPTVAVLPDKNKCPIFHSVILDGLFGSTFTALDVKGGTPLTPPTVPTPIFDPSFISLKLGIDLGKDFPPDPAKLFLIPEIKKKYPTVEIFLAALIKIVAETKIPDIPVPPPLPSIPDAPNLILPDLLKGLIKIPFDIIVSLMAAPLDLLPKLTNPLALFGFIFDLAFKALQKLLDLFLATPATIIASLLVYLKDLCAIICVVIIASILGPGEISKAAATALGLV